jgi:hypothetical protein
MDKKFIAFTAVGSLFLKRKTTLNSKFGNLKWFVESLSNLIGVCEPFFVFDQLNDRKNK